MTEHSRGVAVAGAHRTVRMLAEGEGPFAGELVTRGDGVAVRVDTALLGGWPGWRFAGSEHVAAPEDLVLRADGQDALLPWCVRSAEALLAQRTEEGSLLNGEAVTLAVSVLRGLVELEALGSADDEGSAGRWWLTDDGRPVFVIGAGDSPLSASARVIDALEEQTEDRALSMLLLRLRAAMEEPRRLGAEVARWEQELLEIAAPRPLRAPGADERILALSVGEPARGVRRRELRDARRRDLRDGRRGRGRVARGRALAPGARPPSATRAAVGVFAAIGSGLRRRIGDRLPRRTAAPATRGGAGPAPRSSPSPLPQSSPFWVRSGRPGPAPRLPAPRIAGPRHRPRRDRLWRPMRPSARRPRWIRRRQPRPGRNGAPARLRSATRSWRRPT